MVPVLVSAQTGWTHIESVEDACKAWPDRIETIFRHLNMDGEDLHEVKQAYESNNISEACDLLLKYYTSKASGRAIHIDLPAESTRRNTLADSIVQDIFTFQQVTGKVPRTVDGHLDWSFEGPQDDIEWAWALNRHYPVNTLLPLYYETGNPIYLKYIDQFIKDWIIKSTPYPAKKSSTAMWRGLEVSFRVKAWSKVFHDLMESNHISPATRLLILSSVPDHAHYARNFPWAGQAIFRSSYDKNAHWSFFDIEPWGSGHQHNDMLHVSIAAYGHDFLVDAGRFAYRGEIATKFRPYALGSQAHNVVLIDGKGQDRGDLLAEKEIPPSDYSIKKEESFARGSFDCFKGIEGNCKQTRTLYYKTGEFWVVVDQFTTDRPRKIETLWHWHPDCDVVVKGNETMAENKAGQFLIVPVNEKEWEIDLIKGQETPEIQG